MPSAKAGNCTSLLMCEFLPFLIHYLFYVCTNMHEERENAKVVPEQVTIENTRKIQVNKHLSNHKLLLLIHENT